MRNVPSGLSDPAPKSSAFATNRIGVMGFSAGGHLAATVGTHYDHGDQLAVDPVDRISCRPDFLVLAYPVISFVAPYSHSPSARNLLGDDPDMKVREELSNELHVTPDTPPTFLFSTTTDKVVPAENSVAFYLALHTAGVPVELHIFQKGPHGVGLDLPIRCSGSGRPYSRTGCGSEACSRNDRSFLHTKRERATTRKGPGIGGLVTILLLCAAGASAQVGPQQGGSEIQVWTAGGHSVSGGRGSTGIFDVGLRYGWVLLDSHGPSFLRGRFEYAIDAVPMYLIFQPRNTAYGIGVNPLNLKWNFRAAWPVVPYAELSGGLLFTNHDVPPHFKHNFTPSAALGFHYLGDRVRLDIRGPISAYFRRRTEPVESGVNTFRGAG